ncbi:YqaJ viral recombinase family protein [Methylobacterium oryzisoli]|uniref:YqaJ viral recombinase family protein n=1 Tax=Methylobacterium oryzisoli TaxID=3385502 RepID=UPI0038925F96
MADRVSAKAIMQDRSTFIGGSDARVIMGNDQGALLQLWKEKRSESDPIDLSDNLIVQLGNATESLNRQWFERRTGRAVISVQQFARHPSHAWMGATLDGLIRNESAVFEAKFMLPWAFSEEAAADKHMAQLQHNMLVTQTRRAYLSIVTGGGKWVLIEVEADPVYQTVLLQVERIFWRCVCTGEVPEVFGAQAPKAKLPVVRVVDMTTSNAWAEYAAVFARTRGAHAEHESARAELKAMVPEDAKEAVGHGLRAKRSKAGSISFELMEQGGQHAPVQ